MSTADREKWDELYRAGAYSERPHPSALLKAWIGRLPMGRALDLACGAGRNSLFLAGNGYQVTGIDLSAVGLQRAALAANRQGLDITWIQQDLDHAAVAGRFNVVCLFRYLNRPLIRRLPQLLAAGGVLLVEQHLAVDEAPSRVPIAGPANPDFRVAAGELPEMLSELDLLHTEEGIVTDPDGRHVALCRLVAGNDADHSRLRKAAPSS